MKRIILCFSLLLLFILVPVYGKEVNCANEVQKKILHKLSKDDYGGIYSRMGEFHIKPVNKETVTKDVEEIKQQFSCPNVSIIIDKPVKYSIQDLLDAQKKLEKLSLK